MYSSDEKPKGSGTEEDVMPGRCIPRVAGRMLVGRLDGLPRCVGIVVPGGRREVEVGFGGAGGPPITSSRKAQESAMMDVHGLCHEAICDSARIAKCDLCSCEMESTV